MHGINKAIQICSGCYKKAVYQVGGESKRRVVIPEGHDLTSLEMTETRGGLRRNIECPKGGKNTCMVA